MKNILEEQNLEKNLRLLIVQRVLYSRAKNFKILEFLILIISIGISVLSIIPIEYLEVFPESLFGTVSIILLVISLGIGKVSKSLQEKAAEVQQQFDCGLFNLDYQMKLLARMEVSKRKLGIGIRGLYLNLISLIQL